MLAEFFVTALLTEGWFSDAFSFFQKPKPKTHFEVVIDFFNALVREVRFQAYELIFFEYRVAIKTIVLAGVIYGIFNLIRGRHRTLQSSTTISTDTRSKSTVNTVLYLHNTVQRDSTSESPAKDNYTSNLNRLPIAEIGEFNGRTDARIWTMKLERYMQAMNVN